MRHIGIAGLECFDGPCNPTSRPVCVGCGIRPLKVYQGDGASQKNHTRARRDGVGILLCGQYRNIIDKYPYFAIDNGAYGAWSSGQPWNERRFLHILNRVLEGGHRPDFVAVPDIVAGGLESLRFSVDYIGSLPPHLPYYLVVQDGMGPDDVVPELARFRGIFVGGTMAWKLRTAPAWVELAHRHRIFCHIGRVGPWHRILWASNIGADSIDSTTWVRQDRWHHIETAMVQRTLEAPSKVGGG